MARLSLAIVRKMCWPHGRPKAFRTSGGAAASTSTCGRGDFRRLSQPLTNHQRDIVGGGRALAEFCQRGFDPIADAARRSIEVAGHYFIKPGGSKLFARWIHR